MTLTPDRIAEIEAITTPTPGVRTVCHGPTSWGKYYSDEVHDLCRLALLGLKVEAAPAVVCVNDKGPIVRMAENTRGLPFVDVFDKFHELHGKRVRLVVEESK